MLCLPFKTDSLDLSTAQMNVRMPQTAKHPPPTHTCTCSHVWTEWPKCLWKAWRCVPSFGLLTTDRYWTVGVREAGLITPASRRVWGQITTPHLPVPVSISPTHGPLTTQPGGICLHSQFLIGFLLPSCEIWEDYVAVTHLASPATRCICGSLGM